MSNEQLKPCPFCGEQPEVKERPETAADDLFVCVIACFCGGYSATAHQIRGGDSPDQARANAIAAWNRRAIGEHAYLLNALQMARAYMKYPRTASDALVTAHNKAISEVDAVIAKATGEHHD